MLIEQRTHHDCTICCIAMATGRSYEDVMASALAAEAFDPAKGCSSEYKILKALGLSSRHVDGEAAGDFVCLHRGFEISPEYFRAMAWGRRALLAVPSLNKEGGWHTVYWDGAKLWDPSTRQRYERFGDLRPEEIVLFREAGQSAPPFDDDVRLAA